MQAAYPGYVISVLTPTSRYAEPFLRRLSIDYEPCHLGIAEGGGSFGRQVADGAEMTAQRLGIDAVRIGPEDPLPSVDSSSSWDLFSAGTFEGDVRTVKRAQELPHPPRVVCAVAAGVRTFGDTVENADGVFGVGQWFPSNGVSPELGPTEADFLAAYSNLTGAKPDYPAAQAAAAAILTAHCARRVGGVTRDLLWSAATELDTETLFGGFRINPINGVQIKHEPGLVRWAGERLAAFQPGIGQP